MTSQSRIPFTSRGKFQFFSQNFCCQICIFVPENILPTVLLTINFKILAVTEIEQAPTKFYGKSSLVQLLFFGGTLKLNLVPNNVEEMS